MSDHTFLVAFTVSDPHDNYTREDAERYLHARLPRPDRDPDWSEDSLAIEEWWVAEDDRHDGSDNDSAVFVHPGSQNEASLHLAEHYFTPPNNIVERQVRGQFEVTR